jgi:hypothetical protein
MIMRTWTAQVVIALLAMAMPVVVPAQGSPRPSGAEIQSEQSDTVIRSIEVVDIEDLQSDLRGKVDALLASMKQDELQSLRKLIDETPEAVSALKAKGRVTAQVVAINVDKDGVLTMFTKRTT